MTERYDALKNALSRIRRMLTEGKHPVWMNECLKLTTKILDEYVEPWHCPDCGYTQKIPDSELDQRKCPKCGGNQMLSYAYLEVERMNKQLRILMDCATHYARKPNGHVASKALEAASSIKLEGTWRPEYKKNPRKRFRWIRFLG